VPPLVPAPRLRALLCVAGLVIAPSVATAQPAQDALCGSTLVESVVLEADVDCTRFTGVAITIGADDVVLDGAGYRLLAPDASRAIEIAGGVARATVRDLEVAGWCTGVGIYIDGGEGHVIDNVVASGRGVGVEVRNTSGLTIRDLKADSAADAGLLLQSVALPLTLERLDLSDNLVGLRVNDFTGPFTLGPEAISNIRGSDTGIHLQASVSDLTIEHLTIDGDSFGIDANVTSITGLTLRHLDLRGRVGTGTGLRLQGGDHLIEHVDAGHRGTGFTIASVTNLALRHLRAHGNTGTGLSLTTITAPLELVDLDLSHNLTGFVLNGFDAPDGFVIEPYDAATQTGAITSLALSDTGLHVLNTQHVTFRDFAANGVTYGVRADSSSNAELTFESLDLSGNYRVGTGLFLRGSGHTLRDLVAHRRTTGVDLWLTTDTSLVGLEASACATGLYVRSAGGALDLRDLTLPRNVIGLHLNGVAGTVDAPLQIGPWDPGSESGMIATVEGSMTGVQLVDVQHARVHDLTLTGRSFGLHAGAATNSDIIFEHLDVSGYRVGDGLWVRGARHTVRFITARHRRFGVYLTAVDDLILHDIVAHHNTDSGLYWTGMAATLTAPQIADLDLRDNVRAIRLNGFRVPFTFDHTLGLDLAGSLIGFYLEYTEDLTIENLTLQNEDYGIRNYHRSERLTLRNLDVSGFGRGTGVAIGSSTQAVRYGGPGHRVIGVTASHRAIGAHALFASGVEITDLTAQSSRVGLYLDQFHDGGVEPIAAPSLDGLDLRDNDIALDLHAIHQPLTIDPTIGLDATGSATGIRVRSSSELTFRGLTLANRSAGISATTGSTSLTFEDLDLSGPGVGEGLRLGWAWNATFSHANNARWGHRIRDVIADRRATGLNIVGADGIEIDNVRAHHCSTGLALSATESPPSLSRLDLERNHTGLSLSRVTATAAAPLVLDVWDPIAETGAIASLAHNGTSLGVTNSEHVHLAGLRLDGDQFGLHAESGNNRDFRLDGVDLSGTGSGTGAYLRGHDHVLVDVTANRRATGVELRLGGGFDVQSLTAHHNATGLYLNTPSYPVGLAGLSLHDNATGLRILNLGDAGSLHLGTATFDQLDHHATAAITVTGSPDVTVDDAGLGLVASGASYLEPEPPSDPLCGTALTEDLTLTGDLDCSGTTGTILTLDGDGLTLDGAGFTILAPRATRVIYAVGRDGLTIQDLDLSARRPVGTGIDLVGGSGHTLLDVRASGRATGVRLDGNDGVTVLRLEAEEATSTGLALHGVTGPILLEDLHLGGAHGDGLALTDISGWSPITGEPLAIGPNAIADIAGGATSIHLVSGVEGVRVHDLALDGRTYGLRASHGSNASLIAEDLDLSPWRYQTGLTYGLDLWGDDLTVSQIAAEGRYIGARVANGQGALIEAADLRGANHTGLSVVAIAPPLTLTALSLTDNARGLAISGFPGDPAAPLALGPYEPALSSGAIATLAGSWTAIEIASSSHIRSHDLDLSHGHGGFGVHAYSLDNAHLSFEDLDLSGFAGLGTGLYLAGEGHTLARLEARHRDIGVYVRDAGDLDLSHVRVERSYREGLYLHTVALPLRLHHLELEGNGTGLRIAGFEGPPERFILDPWDELADEGVLRSLRDSLTELHLGAVENLHVRDLILAGRNVGIDADSASNANHLYTDLALSSVSGTGLVTAGAGHRIERVEVLGRSVGVRANGASDLHIEDVTSERNGTGLTLASFTTSHTAPTLLNLTLRHNTQGLLFSAFDRPLLVDPQIGLDLSGSATGLAATSSSLITFRGLTLDNQADGIRLTNSANHSMRFEDLTVLGDSYGHGLYLRGPDHVVEDLWSEAHLYAIWAQGTSALALDGLAGVHNVQGLRLHSLGAAGTGPTVRDVAFTDGGTGIYLYSIAAPTLLDGLDGIDVAGNRTGLYITHNTRNLEVRDLTLPAYNFGLWAANAGNRDIHLRRLDVSGQGRGTGLSLSGTQSILEDIVVSGRQDGVLLAGLLESTVQGVTASGASGAAVDLQNQLTPEAEPTLSGLTLVDNNVGLRGTNIRVPMTFGPAMFDELSGNRTSLYLTSVIRDVTVEGLTLGGASLGLWIDHASSANITARDLDTTGHCRGTGVSIVGRDHDLDRIIAARRANGITVSTGDRVTIAESVLGANTRGLNVVGSSMIVDTSVVADATNTATRFRVVTQANVDVGMTLRVQTPDGPEDRIVQARSGNFITFTTALPAIPEPGTQVHGLDLGDPRVILEDSDVCANGTGLVAQTRPAIATGNYWRSTDGPLHTDNPTGTGDSIDASNVTYDPWIEVPSDKDNHYCNQMPVADAGPDQEVCEGDVVSLDASASYDPDIEPLDFTWTQLAGPSVTLSGADQEVAQFTAPTPPAGEDAHTLTFQVRADDGHLYDRDLTDVTILRGNSFPTAVPGGDQAVDEGGSVALDGSASSDPEGQPLSYLWEQISGPAGSLTGADTATPTFTAPLLDVGGGPISETVVLRLTVTDEPLPEHCGGPRSHSATVEITVDNVNRAPTADAGADQVVLEAVAVQLDGSASADPDGDELSFTWVQLSGAPVTLIGADTATPTFTSPTQPAAGAEVLVFRLTVDDGFGGTDTNEVTVTVDVDGCPDDPDKMEPGACGCGVSDVDSDGDGTPDCLDGCPHDPDKTEPGECGCGVSDVDSDGDGTPDCLDGCPSDPNKTEPGECGCGVSDVDSDGDGTPDCLDGCPYDPDKIAPGACGCGVSDVDSDGDGTPDCLDGCPHDPDKTEPGQCGCGVPDTDTSGDGVADCLSDCSDLPDGTVMREDVPCGVEACEIFLGTEYCEGGALVSTCDPAYALIPDDICDEAPPVVAYAIAYDAGGLPRGTIRCAQHHDGVIACDEDPASPGTLRVYDELLCPGELGP